MVISMRMWLRQPTGEVCGSPRRLVSLESQYPRSRCMGLTTTLTQHCFKSTRLCSISTSAMMAQFHHRSPQAMKLLRPEMQVMILTLLLMQLMQPLVHQLARGRSALRLVQAHVRSWQTIWKLCMDFWSCILSQGLRTLR